MNESKCNLSPLWCLHACVLCVLRWQLEFPIVNSHIFRSCFLVLSLLIALLRPLLQCFLMHLRSIRTCPTGIPGRWHRCDTVSAISLPLCGLCGHALFCCVIMRQVEFHLITVLTHSVVFLSLEWWFLLIVCGGGSFFMARSLAVFYRAFAFNREVSKWNTGAVTDFIGSKCNIFSSFAVALWLWPVNDPPPLHPSLLVCYSRE